MPELDAELAGKFWDLANYVAGFAAAQMVAFLIAVATQRELANWIQNNKRIVVAIMIVFSLVIYVGGVWSS